MPCAPATSSAPSIAKPQLSGRSTSRHPAYACVRRLDKAPRKRPDKPVDISGAPIQTCWSGECAYAKGREEPDELVAGVHDHRARSGFKPDVTAAHGACTMQPPRRCTTQCRRYHVEVPRNSVGDSTFGSLCLKVWPSRRHIPPAARSEIGRDVDQDQPIDPLRNRNREPLADEPAQQQPAERDPVDRQARRAYDRRSDRRPLRRQRLTQVQSQLADPTSAAAPCARPCTARPMNRPRKVR